MAEQINVSISQESVKAIIDAQIQAAVMQALSKDSDRLIQNLVSKVLGEKVDNYGRQTKLDKVIEDTIIAEVRSALSRWAEEKKPLIAAAIEAHLKKNHAQIVQQLVDSNIKQLANHWNITVNVGPSGR